jgi:hypothetical protein
MSGQKLTWQSSPGPLRGAFLVNVGANRAMPYRSSLRTALALATPAVIALFAVPSQASGDPQVQAARELFSQAEEDEDAGRWDEAASKLRRVLEVKRTAGVQYHIALCEEHTGALVAALEDYTIAEREAHDENAQDVLRLVGKRLADLNPRVPRVTLRVVPDTPTASLTLDGKPIARALWATSLPLDPGEHRIEATAEGREISSASIVLNERDSTVLEVKLGPTTSSSSSTPPAPPPPPVALPAAESPAAAPFRTVAVIETVGFAALAGGGLAAFVAADGARTRGIQSCARSASASPDACDSQKTEVRAWDWVAAGAWAGAAAFATLAVVAWTRPSPAPSSAALRVSAGPTSIGIGGDF